MKDSRMIPLVVGVTGHRDLIDEDVPSLQAAVTNELNTLRAKCPASPALLLTSLAEGADQLCARAALECGWEIAAALPMPLAEYEQDFQGAALDELYALLASCRDVFVVPDMEGAADAADQTAAAVRDYRYRQAGIYVASHCHVLLALWDGGPAKPDGCGTAETVAYKLHGPQAGSGLHGSDSTTLHHADGQVLHIHTRRSASDSADRSQPDSAGCGVTRLGDPDALAAILRSTDEFNRDVTEHAPSGSAPDAVDPVARRLADVYSAADAISVRNAVRHRRTIAALSITATILTLCFLLYDEAYLSWMILLCLLLLGALLLINKLSKRLGSHRRYLEYRVLAESLRVQGYLRTAGLGTEVADILPWSVRQDLPWICCALAALTIGPVPASGSSVRSIWILDQKTYHEKALARTLSKIRSNKRIVMVALICMVLTYLITAGFELTWGGMLSGDASLTPEQLEFWRMILKILMGTLSAATLFAGNYYGSLSLDETAADHRRMIALYTKADDRIRSGHEAPALLLALAHEELGENSRWFAYQSMNGPDVAL